MVSTKTNKSITNKTRKNSRSKNNETRRIENIIMGAVGPYENNCAAFGNPAGPKTPNYINVCKLSIGKIPLDKSTNKWDMVTKGILAYDRAETNGAFLGQLNVLAASSFISPHGALWGYDLANNIHESSMYKISGVPIYSITPLLEAGEALFGSNQKTTKYYGQTEDKSQIGPRFYIMPGEIQPCAVKSAKLSGAGIIYSAIGIGIPINALSNKVARLFYEDAGSYETSGNPTEQFIKETEQKLQAKMKNIATAMIKNGKDQIIPIKYSKIFIGFKMEPVQDNEYAEAITLSPYITLAQNAIPDDPKSLAHMSLQEWESLKF